MQDHVDAIHLGLKPFSCTTCGESFTQKVNLRRHFEDMHTGGFKYVCEHNSCGMLFKQKGNLLSHQRRKHNNNIQKYVKKEEARISNLLDQHGIPFESNIAIRLRDADNKKFAKLDFVIRTNNCIIILEVDENGGHRKNNIKPDAKDKSCDKYSVSCEQSRMTEVISALRISGETRSIAFIRYNPHRYRVNDIKQITTQDYREKVLVSTLQTWKATHDFDLLYMYYNVYTVDNTSRCSIWDHIEFSEQLITHCLQPIY
jgi:hypothetical protein